jgi:hypothetical protein
MMTGEDGVGLFTTTSSQLLVPNPLSVLKVGKDHLSYFKFLGKMLGKAIYEVS